MENFMQLWCAKKSLVGWLVGYFEDLRRFSDISAIYRDLDAGDNQSLKL